MWPVVSRWKVALQYWMGSTYPRLGEPEIRLGLSGCCSLDDRQHFPGSNGCAFRDEHLLHCPFFRRLEFVLHLHRFDYEDTLPGFDLGAGSGDYSNDFT